MNITALKRRAAKLATSSHRSLELAECLRVINARDRQQFRALVGSPGLAHRRAYYLLEIGKRFLKANLPVHGDRLKGRTLYAVIAAGLIWGLYNASLSMIFSFGSTVLAERGWSVTQASSATSVVLWLVALSVPLGGILADRTGRPLTVLVSGLIFFAIMLIVAARGESVLPAFIVLGLVCGLPAGPIMSLPAQVLTPDTRAIGMGIYYTLQYVIAVLGPWLAGAIGSVAGTSQITFDFGVIMLVACGPALWAFHKFAQASGARPSVSTPAR